MRQVGRRLFLKRALIVVTSVALLGIASPEPAAAGVSGEEGKIAFTTDRDGNAEIYTMDANGANPANLTGDPAADFDPAWSPDGRFIAFVSDRGGAPAVYTMEVDGDAVMMLTPGTDPDWSPDGTEIAFSRDDGIYLVGVDGTNLRRITDPGSVSTGPSTGPSWLRSVRDSSPAWSPDGQAIAFMRRFAGPTPTAGLAELYTTGVASGSTENVLASTGWGAGDPDWSPDGRQIVVEEIIVHFISARLMTIDVASGNAISLPVPSGFSHAANAVWSPKGVRLATAIAHVNVTPGEIFLMQPDGSNPVNITNHPAFDGDPAWQPLNPYPAGLVDVETGLWYLRDESGAVTSFYYGNPGDYPFVGDWNCDGVDTPGLYRQSDGFVYLRNSNTQGIANIRFFFGNPGDIPLAGDFDGDGCDTVSIDRPSEARIYVINELGANDGGLGAADFNYIFGNPGDKPFVGDFNGDGVDTIGLHRESTGFVYFRNSHTQGVANNSFFFGDPRDRLVAGDWGIVDGVDTPGLFRPSNTTFYFRFTNSSGIADGQYIWGEARWLPVAGEFE